MQRKLWACRGVPATSHNQVQRSSSSRYLYQVPRRPDYGLGRKKTALCSRLHATFPQRGKLRACRLMLSCQSSYSQPLCTSRSGGNQLYENHMNYRFIIEIVQTVCRTCGRSLQHRTGKWALPDVIVQIFAEKGIKGLSLLSS